MCTPIEALVAPGPRVTKQMPGLAGELAVSLRHVRRAAVLPGHGQLDRVARIMERVEHREIALAGYAESVLDTVHLERVDQNLRGGPRLELMLHRLMTSSQKTWYCWVFGFSPSSGST